ncbi:MAG TPA: hydrolase [Flexivirga sp.]|uniref:hydrolase n=1 Tax=Flexivirga sp. TaxID=1962927 RepID=UPI002B676277|nr:hydrolase [Flexivirga sp.]HWC23370.1 hydrolase [Flexivirga sp.]
MITCATCAVEYDDTAAGRDCPICADERQYLPKDGQAWTSVKQLAAAGHHVEVLDLRPNLTGLRTDVGIGQTALLVQTPEGNLLWDPPGYIDDDAIAAVAERGGIRWIAASHPHMFGVQLEWSAAFDDAPVYVNAADIDWLGRRGAAITEWDDELRLTGGLTLHRIGGHFPGSAVAHWEHGADGRGTLLSGDTIMSNPDRRSVSFMRSYPNRIPLSGNVVLRIADRVKPLAFEEIWNNFGLAVPTDAAAAVQQSAQRHAAWVRGDFDHLT